MESQLGSQMSTNGVGRPSCCFLSNTREHCLEGALSDRVVVKQSQLRLRRCFVEHHFSAPESAAVKTNIRCAAGRNSFLVNNVFEVERNDENVFCLFFFL